MHIGGKKRTEQLDDAREVLISQGPNGPIWTTFGQNKMSSSDKEELSHNLAARRHHALLVEAMHKVQSNAASFLESTLMGVAPEAVLQDYTNALNGEGDGRLFLEWVKDAGFGMEQKGLETIVTLKGEVLATSRTNVHPALESEVLALLAFDASLVKLEEAKSN